MTKLTFGGTDLFDAFGIVVETRRDILHPPLHERRIHIPNRDGSYDREEYTYGDREVELSCISTVELSRHQIRELAYALSGKQRLCLSDEPDKYYMAQLCDPSVIQHIGRKGTRYTLRFVCEPFAYGALVSAPLENGENPTAYAGTARAPALLVIRNTGRGGATNILVRASFKRG